MALLEEFSLAEYKDFDGCLLPCEFFTVKEKIEHFEVRDSDIWIASYPKSGATWCEELVWLLCNNLNYEKANMDMNYLFPFIEVNSLYKSLKMFHKKHGITNLNVGNKIADVFKVLDNNPKDRFIKTHLPWNLLPRQIKDGIKKPKIIYILRHPKRIAPLYYHHMANTFQIYKGSKTNFFELYARGKLLYGNYFTNALSYWNKRYLPNVMVITHEDMSSDLKPIVKNIAKFLGKTYDEEELDELVQYLNFSDAKRNFNPRKSGVINKNGNEVIVTDCIDDLDDQFPGDLSEKLDIWVSENTHGTGLPYEKITQ